MKDYKTLNIGLLSTGCSGKWNVDIDEITDTKEEITLFGIVLTHPLSTIQFSVPDLSIILKLEKFLRSSTSKSSTPFTIEKCLGGRLIFIIDECRLWIRVITNGKLGESELFEVVFDESEKKDIADSLKDAFDDL